MARSRPAVLAKRGRKAGVAGLGLLADLVFPRRCGICGRFGAFLCATCRDSLPALPGPVAAAGPGIETLVAVCAYDGNARLLVHRLKYEHLSALAAPIAELMATAWQRSGPLPDLSAPLLVPVPLHPRRERERGFNQSALLARHIARQIDAEPRLKAVARIRPTGLQARQSSAQARADNVAGAFRCREDVAGRDVVIIDDVATTGATLAACAEPLCAAGARSVHSLVFARA